MTMRILHANVVWHSSHLRFYCSHTLWADNTLVSFGDCSLVGRACDSSNSFVPSAVPSFRLSNGSQVSVSSFGRLWSLSASSQATAVIAGTYRRVHTHVHAYSCTGLRMHPLARVLVMTTLGGCAGSLIVCAGLSLPDCLCLDCVFGCRRPAVYLGALLHDECLARGRGASFVRARSNMQRRNARPSHGCTVGSLRHRRRYGRTARGGDRRYSILY